jgi:2',3'-cyclic-nucleotide 2'-phosphodiesterase/3'-nucleotidase
MDPIPRRRRRHPLAVGLLAVAVAFAIAVPASAEAHPQSVEKNSSRITLMTTTDVHARVVNWDYLADKPYAAARGLARISTLVNQVRADKGVDSTLLIDVGDSIQGTALGSYYADAESLAKGVAHPVASAMNYMGYDTMTLGNHEFNFGLPLLSEFQRQLDATLLGANVLEHGTDKPAFAPYVIKTLNLKGNKPIRVGILGITTPGSALWDRTHVADRLDFVGGLETARAYVPKLRAQGVDVVVAALHTGLGSGSSYGDQLPYPENFGTEVAEQVPGIDVVLAGHSHTNVPQRFVTNQETGEQVLLAQAGSHGQVLGVVDVDLQKVKGEWQVTGMSGQHLQASSVADDPGLVALVQAPHQAVVDYVNGPVTTSLQELTLRDSMTEDVAAIDMMALVQAEATRRGLVGTPYEGMPILSARSPLTTSPVSVPAGEVSVRQLSSLYIYDNNVLVAVKVNGAEVVTFLEWVASFYNGVSTPGPHSRSSLVRSGASAQWFLQHVYGLEYDVDLAKPVGQRIVNPQFDGKPLDPEMEFVLASDNYVIGGGGNPPVVSTAPVVYDPLDSIQELITEWAAEQDVLDASTFHTVDWRLVADGQPITFTN